MNSYPAELEAPDIRPYRACSCGIEHAGSYDSGKAGVHPLPAALTRGSAAGGLDRVVS